MLYGLFGGKKPKQQNLKETKRGNFKLCQGSYSSRDAIMFISVLLNFTLEKWYLLVTHGLLLYLLAVDCRGNFNFIAKEKEIFWWQKLEDFTSIYQTFGSGQNWDNTFFISLHCNRSQYQASYSESREDIIHITHKCLFLSKSSWKLLKLLLLYYICRTVCNQSWCLHCVSQSSCGIQSHTTSDRLISNFTQSSAHLS